MAFYFLNFLFLIIIRINLISIICHVIFTLILLTGHVIKGKPFFSSRVVFSGGTWPCAAPNHLLAEVEFVAPKITYTYVYFQKFFPTTFFRL